MIKQKNNNMSDEIEAHQFLSSWSINLNPDLKNKYEDSWLNNPQLGYFGFIPKESKALIIGTFPVLEQRTSGFFYHSDANLFWKILSFISNNKLETIDDKLSWLYKNKIGITDILFEAERTDANHTSSSDIDLNPNAFNNILKLLNDHTNIKDILLTSGGPMSKSLSGKSAGGWLGEHFRLETKKNLKKISNSGATLRVQIKKNDIEINLHYLFTPALQDSQLSLYLRKNLNVDQELSNINFLKNISDKHFKYKILQWAVYFCKIENIVFADISDEIIKYNLSKLLMENR